jgi:hypothetical protein
VKGPYHEASDLDVAVAPERSDWTLSDELQLAARLTRASGREVDLIRLDRAPALLRWEIARAHVVVLADPPYELTRFLADAALDHADMAPLLAHARSVLTRRLRHPGRIAGDG